LGIAGQEVHVSLPIPQVLQATHSAVEALMGETGLLVIKTPIDEEVEQLVGSRYEHAEKRGASRWGGDEG
jgi:hypothetical protein